MTRDRAQLRREQILEAAVDYFAAHGVAQTRTGEIAKSLGVSSGLIFYHFESKDQLIVEAFAFVVERGLRALHDIVESGRAPVVRMVEALRLYGPDDEVRGWRVWVDGWSAALRNNALRESIVQLNDAWEAAFLRLVEDGRETGDFTVDNPGLAVATIIAILDGTAVQALLRGTDQQMWARREAALTSIGVILGLSEDGREQLLDAFVAQR